ncbi:MAG: HD domain-containing protein [Victivallaceae bacterium]|nr:HD domain-containing protein [Victivallaceae bacterium]
MIGDEIRRQNSALEESAIDPRFAFNSRDARREFAEGSPGEYDFRNAFAHDADRILHSHAFARYMDKTQVFFQVENDHIARRALHVQMVSRIARTIGRCLRLNEDLIEAISLGHDIGHTPFGHVGERALSEILIERGKGCFVHNAQSVRVLRTLEKRNGRFLNLTLPVLDGILGHNGEIESPVYRYEAANLRWEVLDERLRRCFSEPKYDAYIFPSTLEGCVVRVADIIAYIGKDFEDAVTLKIIRRDDMPESVARILKPDNRDIIRSLCDDLIRRSYGKDHLEFSPEVFAAFQQLKKFNYDRIYRCSMLREQQEMFFRSMRSLFAVLLDDVVRRDRRSDIFRRLIDRLGDEYLENETPERIVADYISGMTDHYFLKQFERRFMPIHYDYDEAEILNRIVEKYPDVTGLW